MALTLNYVVWSIASNGNILHLCSVSSEVSLTYLAFGNEPLASEESFIWLKNTNRNIFTTSWHGKKQKQNTDKPYGLLMEEIEFHWDPGWLNEKVSLSYICVYIVLVQVPSLLNHGKQIVSEEMAPL